MADKWPAATGNWSTAANWNGGTLPVDGDIIYMDGKTITLDIDLNLPTAEIRTTQRSGGTSGGTAIIVSARSITVAALRVGSTSVITSSGVASLILTNCAIYGAVTGGSNVAGVAWSSDALTFVNCTTYGGEFASNTYGVTTSSGTAVVSGTLNLVQTTAARGAALNITAASSVVLTGSVQHGGAANTVTTQASITYTVTSETCVGSSTTNGNKWNLSGNGTTHSITRQSPAVFAFPTTWTSTHVGVNSNSTTATYNGDVEHSVGAGVMFSMGNYSNSVLRHRGTVYGPPASTANVFCSSSSMSSKVVIQNVARNATSGYMPVLSYGWYLSSDSQIIASTESSTVTLVSAASAGDYPSAANVRSGTAYAYGALTGTCAVPAAGSVANGVAVDNTTGTAVLTASAAQSACNSALAAYETSGVASQADLAGVTVDLSGVLGYLTAILAIFTGMTSLPNWIRRIVRKDSGTSGMSTAQSEINTGGTATFDGTTDSLEAVRDRGDTAWITGAGGGDATAANQSAIINHLTDIKGTGWSSTTDTLEKIRDSITNALASLIATVGITPGSITGFPSSLSIGDSYTEDCDRSIHLFVRDEADDPITSVGDHLFTDTDFEAVVIITQSGRTGRVTGSATWVDASPSESYLKIELPSSETRRAAIGAATVQILLKWTGAQYTLPSVSTSWVAQI